MSGGPPKPAEAAADLAEETSGEILGETEQFIEKLDAVENDRKESQSSVGAAETIEAGVQLGNKILF